MVLAAAGIPWLTLLSLLSTFPLGSQDKRLQIPEPADQKKVEALMRELFKEDYAKKSIADKALLAKKLFEQGMQTKDDPASRFVLLRESRDLASQARDLPTGLRAVGELVRDYDVDAIAMKLGVLATIAKAPPSAEVIRTVAKAYFEVVEEALGTDSVEAAAEAAQSAASLARKCKDIALLTTSNAKLSEVSDRKAKHDKYVKALEVLKNSPEDASSNLAAGQYECWQKGDWKRGLSHLSKGSDPLLKQQAERDLAASAAPPDRASVGDGWWDLAEKETVHALKVHLRARALYWYEQALPGLTGLTQRRVEKRVSDLRMDRFRGAWMDLTDPKLFGLPGNAGDAIDLVATQKNEKYAHLEKLPPGEWDGVSFRLHFAEPAQAIGAIDYEKDAKAIYVEHKHSRLVLTHKVGKDWINDDELNVERKDVYVVTLLLEQGEYLFYLDGVEKYRRPTANNRLGVLTFEADYAPVSFDQIRLRRKD